MGQVDGRDQDATAATPTNHEIAAHIANLELPASQTGATLNLPTTRMPSQSPRSTPTSQQRKSYHMRSPIGSRAPSPTASECSEELPNNVSSEEQLSLLPAECLSGEDERPLLHIDEGGEEYHYALKPMTYSVVFILLVELLERFSFYGINYTQTSYLTGAYDEHWNAGMEAVPASSYVSISVAVAYTTPFLGAFLADSWLGDYWTILAGSLLCYLPGLFLIALTTVPGLLGHEFNRRALAFGLLCLWPVGTGVVKSVVNVFGAKQHHPLLQASLIESYYVDFYMCINIGALIGGVLVPLLAQRNITLAYFLPVAMLACGVVIFTLGSTRYVRSKPKGSLFSKKKKKRASGESISLGVIFRISMLIIPFNIAYSQMATTFIVQGTVMEKAFGFIDAACMNNADAISVLFFGYVISSKIYPWLANRGIKIPTTYKFAIGSALGALAIASALVVEWMIHRAYEKDGQKVSVLWQAWSYTLIGAGEIFAVSAAYEVAFTASSPETKALSSAVNLFCIGGLPSVICIALYHACRPWFENKHGTTNITRLQDYASAHVDYYFLLLLGICVAGILVNLLPPVREFVESIEEKATDLLKSPKTPLRRESDEESPLIKLRRHQAYLKYGSGPVLYKSGSMRAGASLRNLTNKKQRPVKRNMLAKLYRSEPLLPGVPVLNSKGMPVKAGALLKRQMSVNREEERLLRASSDTDL